MIIEAKPLGPIGFKIGSWVNRRVLNNRFNKLVINKAVITPNASYLLMANHFSFLDGLLAYYLGNEVIWADGTTGRLYLMVNKRQMQKNKWTRYFGCFSIDPRSRSIAESFDYAAQILSKPGNLLIFYPQGNLESIHVKRIHFENGLKELVKRIKGNCQLIWSSNIIEYFESTKPSIYFDMLDCGRHEQFDFDELQEKVNAHHKYALERHIRLAKTKS